MPGAGTLQPEDSGSERDLIDGQGLTFPSLFKHRDFTKNWDNIKIGDVHGYIKDYRRIFDARTF
jgi:hypothetical protein